MKVIRGKRAYAVEGVVSEPDGGEVTPAELPLRDEPPAGEAVPGPGRMVPAPPVPFRPLVLVLTLGLRGVDVAAVAEQRRHRRTEEPPAAGLLLLRLLPRIRIRAGRRQAGGAQPL